MITKMKPILVLTFTLFVQFSIFAQQPTVTIEPLSLQGTRPLQEQTESAVVRDYIQSWQSLNAAFDDNQPNLLDQNFVGTARNRFTQAINERAAMGIHTRYVDHTHDIRIVFYSPEGLSIQLIDTVSYDEQIFTENRTLTSQKVSTRYVVVLTPDEVRWRVRIMQTSPQ